MRCSSKDSSGSLHLSKYEQEQRRRTLCLVLWVTLIASVILGVVNLFLDATLAYVALFSLAVICLPTLWLNREGHYILAGIILSAGILVVADLNLIDGGGLHDPGVVSYPILIVLGSLLFGKRSAPFFAAGSIASLVLIAALEMYGVIQTNYDTDPDDVVTISVLLIASAILIWVIMDNTEKNLERIKRSESELREAYDRTLEGWSKVLETRDKETEGHSRRVVELSIQLAMSLGCSEDEIVEIKRGALLHDIGKLTVPDQILFKPGPLTDEEREVVQQHPVHAQQILSQIPFLQKATSIPYCHHERWDGQGYPQGLKGEEIPLPARIFAVVDNWEALNSDRPYRKAWPQDRVLEYLHENSGIIFDARVVDAFARLVG